jgi:hypothetical protein
MVGVRLRILYTHICTYTHTNIRTYSDTHTHARTDVSGRKRTFACARYVFRLFVSMMFELYTEQVDDVLLSILSVVKFLETVIN